MSGSHTHGHEHTHGTVDPTLLTTQQGLWATKWSLVGLGVTAVLQLVIVYYTQSVALLADTIHNFADAATAIPLAIAFWLVRRKPTKQFTYGYGRAEDLAGLIIVLIILGSAVWAGYESLNRLWHPQTVNYLPIVMLAGLIGFAGNELVAMFRIKVGKRIHSAALIADGYHARTDGLTSLAVVAGAIGTYLGFPLADPIVGLLITILIVKVVWDSVKTVFVRLLDGVDPKLIDQITEVLQTQSNVKAVEQVQARWSGHRLFVTAKLQVHQLNQTDAHELEHELQHVLPQIGGVTIQSEQ